jgi:hypothetical protein
LIVCGLDPEFVEEVSEELGSNAVAQLRVQIDIRDQSLGYLMRLLENAAKSGESSNNLYVDHLIYALTFTFVLSWTRQAIYLYTPRGITSSQAAARHRADER